jgi:hypothetical protein
MTYKTKTGFMWSQDQDEYTSALFETRDQAICDAECELDQCAPFFTAQVTVKYLSLAPHFDARKFALRANENIPDHGDDMGRIVFDLNKRQAEELTEIVRYAIERWEDASGAKFISSDISPILNEMEHWTPVTDAAIAYRDAVTFIGLGDEVPSIRLLMGAKKLGHPYAGDLLDDVIANRAVDNNDPPKTCFDFFYRAEREAYLCQYHSAESHYTKAHNLGHPHAAIKMAMMFDQLSGGVKAGFLEDALHWYRVAQSWDAARQVETKIKGLEAKK